MTAQQVPPSSTVARVDFPYYDGRPVQLRGRAWWVVVAGCVLAFASLAVVPIGGPAMLAQWIHALLFVAIPLLALAIVAGHPAWTAIFRRVRGRDVAMMVGFALLNTVVSFAVAAVVTSFWDVTANPVHDMAGEMSAGELVLLFTSMIPQLVGEELVTILPLLALLYLGVKVLGWSRRATIVVAWVVTALIFGAIHLPTYDWNLAQCFLIIGVARLVLTIPFLITKNVWVSAGAHVLNDWLQLSTVMLGASAVSLLA